jgi:NAD(P)-dependent dehydrogenase (short-subunit alcohol dehydrogenase family)
VRDTLRERFGVETFDHLVNNAGIGSYAPYAQTTPEQFDELVQVNLRAPFFLTQALLPLINEGGRVLNVTTALTRGVVPGMSAYAATKGAIEVLTRYQAVELADRSIRVNTLMGGAAATGFGGGMMRSPDVRELAAHTIAQGRIAEIDDITAAVPAILSDAFQWATGSIIDVSGGQSL